MLLQKEEWNFWNDGFVPCIGSEDFVPNPSPPLMMIMIFLSKGFPSLCIPLRSPVVVAAAVGVVLRHGNVSVFVVSQTTIALLLPLLML